MVGLMNISRGDAEEFYGLCKGELMGYLEMIQLEILQQISGELKPDIVERTFVKPTKSKKND